MALTNHPPVVTTAQTTKTLAFPFQMGPLNFPAMAGPNSATYFKIVSLLFTSKGEKVMNSGYGVNLHEFVFANHTSILRARVAAAVRAAIEEWVPEARVERVDVYQGDKAGNKTPLIVDVLYREVGQPVNVQVQYPPTTQGL